MSERLTTRQQLFIEAFDGNGTEACRKAGYKGNDNALAVQAHENLSNPKIAAAIEARQKAKKSALIATREERQKFWTETMKDSETEMYARLKASELLGKSEADFVERRELSGPDGETLSVKVVTYAGDD